MCIPVCTEPELTLLPAVMALLGKATTTLHAGMAHRSLPKGSMSSRAMTSMRLDDAGTRSCDPRIRCRLLLGGPAGDGRLDPKARTAICLHGIGEDLSFWEEARQLCLVLGRAAVALIPSGCLPNRGPPGELLRRTELGKLRQPSAESGQDSRQCRQRKELGPYTPVTRHDAITLLVCRFQVLLEVRRAKFSRALAKRVNVRCSVS